MVFMMLVVHHEGVYTRCSEQPFLGWLVREEAFANEISLEVIVVILPRLEYLVQIDL